MTDKRWIVLACGLLPGMAAACEERVTLAQERIEQSLEAPLSSRERAELTTILYDLCAPRQPGASVYEDDERTARTTHGLNTPRPRDQDESISIIAVDVDGPRRHSEDNSRRAE